MGDIACMFLEQSDPRSRLFGGISAAENGHGAMGSFDDVVVWGSSMQIFFLAFYTVEILLKLAVHRCYFFWCEELSALCRARKKDE